MQKAIISGLCIVRALFLNTITVAYVGLRVKMVSFLAAESSTFQTYQLFFPYISWDKYHHIYIYTSYALKVLHWFKINLHFRIKAIF